MFDQARPVPDLYVQGIQHRHTLLGSDLQRYKRSSALFRTRFSAQRGGESCQRTHSAAACRCTCRYGHLRPNVQQCELQATRISQHSMLCLDCVVVPSPCCALWTELATNWIRCLDTALVRLKRTSRTVDALLGARSVDMCAWSACSTARCHAATAFEQDSLIQ